MKKPLNRWQAFAIHLSISVIVFLVVLGVIAWAWYPGALMHMGAWQGVKVLAGVHLIIGPVLTLLIFNPAKKSLKFDLLVVVVLQLAALGYGVKIIESQRIGASVLLDGQLYVLNKQDLSEQGISLDEIRQLHGQVPVLAILDLPENTREIRGFTSFAALSSKPAQYQFQRYLPFGSGMNDELLASRLQWRFNNLQKNTADDCYWALVESMRYRGRACINAQGIQYLE